MNFETPVLVLDYLLKFSDQLWDEYYNAWPAPRKQALHEAWKSVLATIYSLVQPKWEIPPMPDHIPPEEN